MMKKIAGILAVVGLVVTGAAALSFAGSGPATGVNNSMHDMNIAGGGAYNKDDFLRVCIFCHTPHNAQPNGAVPAPLWNHAATAANPAPYTWAAPANLNIDFTVNGGDNLIGPSRLCMGCHDGVTAVDSHGPSAGTAQGNNNGTHALTAAGRFINDLTITHPISFQYGQAVSVRNVNGMHELIDPLTDANPNFIASLPANPDTKTRAGFTYTGKPIADTMYSGFMTCASCHEVHNTNNAVNDPAISNGAVPNYFVWAKETGSMLCLSCHVK